MIFVQLLQTVYHLFRPRRSNNQRPWLLHPEALLLLTLIAAVVATVLLSWSLLPTKHGFILGYASSITPFQVVEMTNRERSKNGLPSLELNAELSLAATAKGKHMFANQYWAHMAPDGTQPWSFIREAGYTYTVAGENLARDFAETETMVAAWMASPTHKANIVNPRYTDIGIAVIDGTLEGFETTLVVQMFGAPKAAEALAAQTTPQAFTISQTANEQGGEAPQLAAVAAAETGEELLASPGATLDEVLMEGTPSAQIQTEPPVARNAVLASFLVPQGEVLVPPLFTPLQLMKAVFLSITMILILTLVYDGFVIGNRQTLRMVGKNMAHIAFWFAVTFLIIFFKGGIIG